MLLHLLNDLTCTFSSLAIAPWNVPMYLSMRAVMIPIICGNAVILKSSEITPRSQSIVAEVFKEVGLINS